MHPGEQILDLGERVGLGPDRGFGQQDRLFSERPYLLDGAAEDTAERVGRPQVVPVDADPGDILLTGPPGFDRPGAGTVVVDRPEPGDVLCALAGEQRDDVPPRGDERGWPARNLSPACAVLTLASCHGSASVRSLLIPEARIPEGTELTASWWSFR
jgi:hypothetical protein